MPDLKQKELLPNLWALLCNVQVLFSYSVEVLKRRKKALLKIFIARGISWVIGITLIYITKLTLDRGIFAGDMKVFTVLTLAGALAYLISKLLQYLSSVILTEVKADFSRRTNNDLLTRLMMLDFLKLRRFSSSENSFIMDYDNSTIELLVFSEIPSLVSFLKVPVFFVLAFLLSPNLSMAAFFVFPVIVLNVFFVADKRRYLTEKEAESSCRYFSVLHDILLNAKLVKSYFLERWAIGRVSDAFGEKISNETDREKFSAKTRFIVDVLARIGVSLFWLYGGFLIIRGGISFGTFTAVVMYMGLIFAEAHKFSNVVHGINQQRFSIKRSAEFISSLPDVPESDATGAAIPDGFDISVESISFGYLPERNVLEGVSARFKASEWTLVTGPTGVGKSTLMGIMGRLYSPGEGKVMFGSENIADISSDELSAAIAVVHQHSYILKDTLRNNIFLGKEALEEEMDVVKYCSMMEDFVSHLPLGYNTNIDEFGGSFSGGERQRIAIARAIAARPKVLILDEATSFVDMDTEKAILSRIKQRFPSMTVIMVSHRDSVRSFADNIFELSREGIRVLSARERVEMGE